MELSKQFYPIWLKLFARLDTKNKPRKSTFKQRFLCPLVIIGYTPKVEFNELMTEFFKECALGHESSFFRDWLAFRDQRDVIHIDKPCWTYVNDPVTFWDCAADISPGLAKLAGRLMEVPGNSVPGKQSRLYFAK